METDIEVFVKSCLGHQYDKVERRLEASLLQPLPTPERPWSSILMDFRFSFPKMKGMSLVMVVVVKFLKYTVFLAAPHECPAAVAIDIFG